MIFLCIHVRGKKIDMREREQDFEEKTEVGKEGGSMFHFCCCDQNTLTKSILGARAYLAYNSRL